MTDLTCPTCGHPVRVVSGDEGTNSYEPVEAPRDSGLDVERLANPSGDLAAALTATPAEGPTILDAWQVIEREYPVATVERLHAALAATPADSLDAAWAEAEAALPEGWGKLTVFAPFNSEWTVRVEKQRSFGRGGAARYDRWDGDGPTPAAALRALAARLREQEGSTGDASS